MIIIYELYGNHSDGVGECSFFYPGQHRGTLGSSFSGGVEKEEPKVPPAYGSRALHPIRHLSP